jgi:hypothetical protein
MVKFLAGIAIDRPDGLDPSLPFNSEAEREGKRGKPRAPKSRKRKGSAEEE